MKIFRVFALLMFFCFTAAAQPSDPVVVSWIVNADGSTGYNGIPTNVQRVMYNATDVWVSATCIPGYDIGPWPGNPNQPANQDFTFRITRTPHQSSGATTVTPLGHIGVWKNGVSIFNQKDARSYNNQRVWNQNALYFEGSDFDSCLGHPAPNGEYHHHVNPRCLWDDTDTQHHAPLLGYAFDGFPVYGGYAFKNTDGTGGIVRIRSSYRYRDITDRSSLADGTVLAAGQYGPAIGGQYGLGAYCEDFEFISDLGDLDVHNGRFCITPEYPQGTYAYFVTLDENGEPAYPYVIGAQYYGVIVPGNTGLQSGHNTPADDAVQYIPTSVNERDAVTQQSENLSVVVYPNLAVDVVYISTNVSEFEIAVFDLVGNIVYQSLSNTNSAAFTTSHLSNGMYQVVVRSDASTTMKLFVVNK